MIIPVTPFRKWNSETYELTPKIGTNNVRFNFDRRINVGIICTANVGVCGTLSAFHDVEQVIFTDCIEVDSDLPQSCKDFVEHLATLARPAELKVVRLYSEGTVEEALLNAKYKKITQTCGKELEY